VGEQVTAFKRATPAAFGTRRAITASAQRMSITNRTDAEIARRRSSANAAWQEEAWTYYDAIGEIKFAYNLLASVTSRVRLYVGVVVDQNAAPVPVSEAFPAEDAEDAGGASSADDADEARDTIKVDAELARRAEGEFTRSLSRSSVPSILRSLTLNVSVPGECYLVLEGGKWTARSTSEVKIAPGADKYQVQRSAFDSSGVRYLRDGSTVGRIWREHPRYSMDPDSAMLGMRADCEELLLLSRVIRSTARARLNAGILYIPDDISVVARTNPDDGSAESELEGDPIEIELVHSMVEPVNSENSAASVVPMLLRGPGEMADKIKYITVDRKSDEYLVARADRVLERILQGLDVPKDIVTGLANVKYCATPDHEALTRGRGWVGPDELRPGDVVMTLNHDTGRSEWQPVSAVNVFDAVDEPMLSLESATHSSLTTAAHSWPVFKSGKRVAGSRRRWTTSESGFSATDRIQIAADHAGFGSEPKYSDDFVRLVALYTSDGWHEQPSRGRPRANVSKFAPDLVERVRPLLAGSAEYSLQNGGVRFRLGPDESAALFAAAPGKEKRVTRDFVLSLTESQLEVFLRAFVDIGDGGEVGSAGTMRFWQSDPGRLEAIELAAILSGRTVRWVRPTAAKKNAWGGRSGPCHGLTVSAVRRWVQPHKATREWIRYTGRVWCPTTPNGTWLARRDGRVFFTGNSNAIQIDESLYKAHVEPLALMLCDAFTDIVLHPTLRAWLAANNQDANQDLSSIVVWYDPSEVVTRPNRSEDANAGYDKYLLSGSSWRDAHGFSDTDAPDQHELAFRMAVEKAQVPAEMATVLLNKLLPDLTTDARGAATQGDDALPAELEALLNDEMPELPEVTETSVPEEIK